MSSKFNHSKLVAYLVAIIILGVLSSSRAARADTLRIEIDRLKFKIERHCKADKIICDRVEYKGTDLQTGKNIQLSGKPIHAACVDRGKGCSLSGYEFRKGKYRYFVNNGGLVTISRNGKTVIGQKGIWGKS